MVKGFKKHAFTLRQRIFLSMLFLTIFSSVLISVVSLIHFRYEAKEYHEERLSRKENAIKEHIDYILLNTDQFVTAKTISVLFKDRIHELSDIHSLEINFYDLKGRLLISSKTALKKGKRLPKLSKKILKKLETSNEKRIVETNEEANGTVVKTSYTYIKDANLKNIAILNIPYVENSDFYDEEVRNFLSRYAQVYFAMLVFSILLSYFLSKNITKSLTQISQKLALTKLNQRNEKLALQPGNHEINSLILSYNLMVDKLEESAQKLAQSEREHAWREMAKQVAHEIKNPLTPMKLTVQNFQRKFNPTDPESVQKLNDYSETLIQQIDTMTAVASAFSNFASMPLQQNELVDVVKIIKMALEIFNEEYILFNSNETVIFGNYDKSQLIRITTNLVKNAIQAIPEEQEEKLVVVQLIKSNNSIILLVQDNGIGIENEQKEVIFEPKFTTKSSGMGLGLAIIKNIVENYNGTITVSTERGKGSTFSIELPLN